MGNFIILNGKGLRIRSQLEFAHVRIGEHYNDQSLGRKADSGQLCRFTKTSMFK